MINYVEDYKERIHSNDINEYANAIRNEDGNLKLEKQSRDNNGIL